MKMLDSISAAILNHAAKNSFCFSDVFSSYAALGAKISGIADVFKTHPEARHIGVITNNDIETYASNIAALFCGKAFVPINPENPAERNMLITAQAGLDLILTSLPEKVYDIIGKDAQFPIIDTSVLTGNSSVPEIIETDDSATAYILFTSGSTGIPKGVPITRGNLNAFIEAFFALGYELNENDRVLQIFDLTFDLSLMSYLVPLTVGACVYPVPSGEIKYTAAYTILEDHEITVALMVPSVLSFLRKYFDEVRLEKMRYSLFCGEALYNDLTQEWKKCVPNALVQNVYGPTEATIFCLTYDCSNTAAADKEYNGIVCIGKPMKGTLAVVVDENGTIVPDGTKGELCLAGTQLTPGYWKNPQKNSEAFIHIEMNGEIIRFYRSGDICFVDDDCDFMFCGRLDNQVKIQGFRVELSEIEHHAREYTGLSNVVAVPLQDARGNAIIQLVLEKYKGTEDALMSYLRTRLPAYMIPSVVRNMDAFPLNVNGKVDRKALKKIVETV
ncbi:MAG: AMP-binding protein [Bacteroidota bacterium]